MWDSKGEDGCQKKVEFFGVKKAQGKYSKGLSVVFPRPLETSR
jgi:hypothetical protein